MSDQVFAAKKYENKEMTKMGLSDKKGIKAKTGTKAKTKTKHNYK